MWTTIQTLLLINLIIVMIFNSGFVDSMDAIVNKKFPLHHIGPPLGCALCMTFWTGLGWLLVTGNLSIPTLALALANATLTSVTGPLLKTLENYLLKIIELMNRIL